MQLQVLQWNNYCHLSTQEQITLNEFDNAWNENSRNSVRECRQFISGSRDLQLQSFATLEIIESLSEGVKEFLTP